MPTQAEVKRVFNRPMDAQAVAIRLALLGADFSIRRTGSDATKFEVSTTESHANSLEREPTPAYAFVQEGGSSTELYIHAHDSSEEAEKGREDCDRGGAYRTCEVIEVSPLLNEIGETFWREVEAFVRSTNDLHAG